MTKKKLTQNPLFLPLMCVVLVLAVNVVYDIAQGNAFYDFFRITMQSSSSGEQLLSGRLITILNRGSEVAILAIGMTLVVSASAGTDISVGSVMSLCASFCCMLVAGFGVSAVNSVEEFARPLVVGLIGALLMGCLCGAFNGTLVAYLNIQPMVATLIMFTAGRSIAAWINNNQLPIINDLAFKYAGTFLPGIPVPTPIFITAVMIALFWLILKFTNLGLYTQSVGINPHSSRLNGIDPQKVKLLTYVILGVCVAVAGFIRVSRSGSINYSRIAENIEMDAILAVALGGNALSGGKFNIYGSILGAYIIQFLTTTLYKYEVPSTALPAYKAVVVILLVVFSSPVVREKLASLKKAPAKAAKEAT